MGMGNQLWLPDGKITSAAATAYMKQVGGDLGWQDENLYAIHVNTELGSNNAVQNAASSSA